MIVSNMKGRVYMKKDDDFNRNKYLYLLGKLPSEKINKRFILKMKKFFDDTPDQVVQEIINRLKIIKYE